MASAAASKACVTKVDIQTLVEDWALDYFRRKATRKERRLLDQDFIRQELDWRRVQFTHDDAVYEPQPPSPGSYIYDFHSSTNHFFGFDFYFRLVKITFDSDFDFSESYDFKFDLNLAKII